MAEAITKEIVSSTSFGAASGGRPGAVWPCSGEGPEWVRRCTAWCRSEHSLVPIRAQLGAAQLVMEMQISSAQPGEARRKVQVEKKKKKYYIWTVPTGFWGQNQWLCWVAGPAEMFEGEPQSLEKTNVSRIYDLTLGTLLKPPRLGENIQAMRRESSLLLGGEIGCHLRPLGLRRGATGWWIGKQYEDMGSCVRGKESMKREILWQTQHGVSGHARVRTHTHTHTHTLYLLLFSYSYSYSQTHTS